MNIKKTFIYALTTVFLFTAVGESFAKTLKASHQWPGTKRKDGKFDVRHEMVQIIADEIKKAIDVLISEGKIRMFGVSNFSKEQTELISLKSKVKVNQIQFSLSHNSALFDSSLDYMISNNIIPMSWSPLGLFFKEKNKSVDRVNLLLDELCKKYSATKDQLLLSWILKHPSKIHPVIGTTKKERILNAVNSEAVIISEIDWFRMLETYLGHKLP